MKVLVSWLRELVDVPGSPQEIADRMSLRGFAVEGIEAVGADDAVLDFEVTANRPDCMSVTGLAREVATAYGLDLHTPGLGAGDSRLATREPVQRAGDIDIVIDDLELCPRYAGAVADVTIGPAPEWMQARLRASGVRPISNIVDVTNYVLIELGHPMHAFDVARVGGRQIRVRRAQETETIRTLDDRTRNLTGDMLVIADAEKPIAVAGVMGGAESEVTSSTRTIVLESAYFDPRSVRRTSKKLGLKTEASMRFERGADPHLPVTALNRAIALLEQAGAGRACGPIIDRVRAPFGIEPRTLTLRRRRLEGLLGAAIPDADVERILSGLGFSMVRVDDGWRVTAPTRRVDVTREVDLIEDVARHFGFDRVPVTFPALTTAAPALDPRITRARQLRTLLTGAGFHEAVTFGFIAEAKARLVASEQDIVPIANPLSETFAVLRPSALPGLVEALAHNRRREQRDVRLFEVGARFSRSAGERQVVACAWTGAVGGDHWSAASRDVDFFDMKGLIERVCEGLGLVDVRAEARAEAWLVPGRAATVVAGNAAIGLMGQLAPAIVESYGLAAADAVYVAEIDLDLADASAGSRHRRVEPLPRFPSVTRDISVLVADTLQAEMLRRAIHEAAPDTLVRVQEFDRYQGKGIPDGNVSLSLRLTFRSPDRTLTDAEVQTAMEAVLAALQERHGAMQR